MANTSIEESRSVPPSSLDGSEANLPRLSEIFLLRRGYTRLSQGVSHVTYGQFRNFSESDQTKYFTYDILILAHAENVEAAMALIPRLDAECERLRHGLLQGKSIQRDISVKKHHFITLHKPYTCHSYEVDGCPVGFALRPLILVQEPDQWEYFAGETARVDVLSFDGHMLDLYLERRKETLKSAQPHLLNLAKYRYWKVGKALLNYGHYPLILAWIAYFMFTIFQLPFPLAMSGMVASTVVIYGVCLGLTFLTYRQFKQAHVKELQETAVHQVTPARTTNHSPTEDVQVVVEEPTESVEPDLLPIDAQFTTEAPQSQSPSLPELKVAPVPEHNGDRRRDRYYVTRIQTSIRAVLHAHASQPIIKQGSNLLRNTFCWLIGQTQRDIPRNDPLSSLLSQAQHDGRVAQWLDSLVFWAKKIDAKTPLDQQEIKDFKKFLLLFLFDLRLLPRDLHQTVRQSHAADQQRPQPPRRDPLPDTSSELQGNRIQEALEDLRDHVERAATDPPAPLRLEPSPPEVPNLEVATLSFHTGVAGISARDLRKVRERDQNGIFCTLFLEITNPDAADILTRFEACTKDLPVVHRNHIDLCKLNDPALKQEIQGHTGPVVMIGCGKNRQVIPYGERDDDVRLPRVVMSFLQPEGHVSLRERTSHIRREVPSRDSLRENDKEDEMNVSIPPPPKPISLPPLSKDSTPSHPSPSPPAETPNPVGDSTSAQPLRDTQDHMNSLESFPRGSVLMDGSNIVFIIQDHHQDKSGPKLECVFAVLEELEKIGIPRQTVAIYFDANIEYKLSPSDKHRLEEGIKEGQFRRAPPGTKCDVTLVQMGDRLSREFVVISNDRYRDMPNWFPGHRVGVGCDWRDDTPYLAIKSKQDLLNAYYGLGGKSNTPNSNQRRRRESSHA